MQLTANCRREETRTGWRDPGPRLGCVLAHHRSDQGRIARGAKITDRRRSGFNALDKVIYLRGIFFPSNIEPNRSSQFGRVPHLPSGCKAVDGFPQRAKVDLDFLPVDADTAIGSPNIDLDRHFTEALVAPIGRQLSVNSLGKLESRVDFVVNIAREHAVHDAAGNRNGSSDEIIEQI